MKFLIESNDFGSKIILFDTEDNCKKQLENLQIKNAEKLNKYIEGQEIYQKFLSNEKESEINDQVLNFIENQDVETNFIKKLKETVKIHEEKFLTSEEQFIRSLNNTDQEKIKFYNAVWEQNESNPMNVSYKIVSLNEII